MHKKIFFLVICIVFMTNFIFALGITPSIHRVDFKPNMELEYEFRVIASSDQEIEIYASGDLDEYVKFSKKKFTGTNSFIATIILPEKLDRPGKHTLLLGAREIVDTGSGVGTSSAVQVPIVIRVPYPGKYAELSFVMKSANEDESIDYDLLIYSRGDESIDTESKIDVYDNSDNKVESLNLGSKTVLNQDTYNYGGSLVESYGAGDYRAVATVDYVAGTAKAESRFRVGHLFVDMNGFSEEVLKLGIQPFNIEIESYWNDPIEDVFAEVYISRDGEKVLDFLTPSTKLDGWQKKILTGYLDTGSLDYGSYDLNVILDYGKRGEFEGKFKIVKENESNFIYYIGGLLLLVVLYVLWKKRSSKMVVKKDGKK